MWNILSHFNFFSNFISLSHQSLLIKLAVALPLWLECKDKKTRVDCGLHGVSRESFEVGRINVEYFFVGITLKNLSRYIFSINTSFLQVFAHYYHRQVMERI